MESRGFEMCDMSFKAIRLRGLGQRAWRSAPGPPGRIRARIPVKSALCKVDEFLEAGGLEEGLMPLTFATLPRAIRAGSIRTLPVALALLVLAAPAQSAQAAKRPDLAGLIPTLNRICSDLSRSREELRTGMLDADQFSERVLALFVDADSVREVVEATPPAARLVGGPFFAADHSLRYLID